MCWEQLVHEIVNNTSNLDYRRYTICNEYETFNDVKEFKAKRSWKRHRISNNGEVNYLTQREAECIFYYVMKSYSARIVALKLGLSKRTIEFYLGNIKKKLGCSNKAHLISYIKNSDYNFKLDD